MTLWYWSRDILRILSLRFWQIIASCIILVKINKVNIMQIRYAKKLHNRDEVEVKFDKDWDKAASNNSNNF
jgi:hypothetical protein